MPKKEILKQAMMAMEGEALEWFMWSEDRYPFCDWTDFRLLLQKRFGAESSNNLLRHLMNLNQEDSVLENEQNSNEFLLIYLILHPIS